MDIVDLELSSSAQESVLFDSVQRGAVPEKISVLNADVVVSHQLVCEKSSSSVLSSGVGSYSCFFHTKVIRINTGENIFTKSENFNSYGINENLALEFILKKRVRGIVRTQVEVWKGDFGESATWKLELFVSGFKGSGEAGEIAGYIASLKEVISSKLISYSEKLSKIRIEGKGSENLNILKKHLENDREIFFRITYDSGKMLHAERDLKKQFRRKVMLVLNIGKMEKKSREIEILRESGSGLLRSWYMGLDYVEIEKSALTELDMKSFVKKAGDKNTPLIIFNRLYQNGKTWQNSADLVNSRNGEVLLTVLGSGETPFSAIEKSAGAMSDRYEDLLRHSSFRKLLKISKDIDFVKKSELEVERFETVTIFPALTS